MKKNNGRIYYIVEGQTEEKIIKELKNKYIFSGKVKVKNLVNEKISDSFIRTLNAEILIIVFDTDVQEINILEENLKRLKKVKTISKIIFVPQIKNLEDEIVFSTEIKRIEELYQKNKIDIKKHIIQDNSFCDKLEKNNFSIAKFWSRNDTGIFKKYINGFKDFKI